MFITVTSVSTLCVIALLFIYRAKLPFFESYRVNPKVTLKQFIETLALVVKIIGLMENTPKQIINF